MLQRIQIMGCGGSGKSTLAAALGARLGLPVVHLDSLYWNPGWVESTPEVFGARLDKALKGDSWIIDGNYKSWRLEQRLTDSDAVIYLDFPRIVCVTSILTRYLQTAGRTRADMAEGCPERFDADFFLWIWNYKKRDRQAHLDCINRYAAGKTYLLRKRGEIAPLIEKLAAARD